MPGIAEGEKTLPDKVAPSLALLESTEDVPSVPLATWGIIILLLKGDTRVGTIPLLPSLSSATNMFLLVISEVEETEPRGPLLETMFPDTTGMLFVIWFDRLFLPIFLMSATSESDGDGLRTGKLLISSSFTVLDWFTNEALTALLTSKELRREFEPGVTDEMGGGLDKLGTITFIETGVAKFATGVVAVELTVLLLGGGVLAPTSELLSWEAVSSACSWKEAFED